MVEKRIRAQKKKEERKRAALLKELEEDSHDDDDAVEILDADDVRNIGSDGIMVDSTTTTTEAVGSGPCDTSFVSDASFVSDTSCSSGTGCHTSSGVMF